VRPGTWGAWADVSSFHRGLNGIMIDVEGLPEGVELDARDFDFKVGTGGDPADWPAAPAPSSITTRRGGGSDGSDRVTLIWPDDAIKNAILQVTVVPSERTGLAADVFAFGNLVGNVGGSVARARVDAIDVFATTRAATRAAASVNSYFDHDRNGRVDLRDVLITRRNGGRRLSMSPLPPPPEPPAAPLAAPEKEQHSPATALLRGE
jgi:hypothetical protein